MSQAPSNRRIDASISSLKEGLAGGSVNISQRSSAREFHKVPVVGRHGNRSPYETNSLSFAKNAEDVQI